MNEAQRAATDIFVRRGWTIPQACGIVANLIAESGLRPDAVGDGGAAYGIAQWHPPRQADFARIFGKDIRASSIDEQIDFVDWELVNTESAAGSALRACATAAEAAEVVCRRYERPADQDGDSIKRAAIAQRLLTEYHGAVPTQPAAPIEEAGTPAQPQEKTMVPILGALLPSIVEAIPALIAVFGKGERAKDNAKAAQVVAETVIKATNAVNLQEAVEKIQTDPVAKRAATAAVLAEPAIATLMEVGGGVEAARAANAKLMAEADVWWKVLLNPVLLVTVMVLPLVYVIVIELVRYMDKVSADVIAQTIGTVIGLVLGGVVGFWMGQTYQQTTRRASDPTR